MKKARLLPHRIAQWRKRFQTAGLFIGFLAGLIALPVGAGARPGHDSMSHSNHLAPVAAKAGMVSLNSLDALKERFRGDAGKIRFVALVSPT